MKLFLVKILLGTLCFCALSCSSSDDDSTSITNLFIGTWQPVVDVEVCSTGNEEFYPYSSCEQNGRLIVSSNGSFSESTFYAVSNSQCMEEFSYSGSWQLNNGELQVTIDDEIIDVNFYEVTATRLLLGQYVEENPGYTCDGENDPSHFYTEYERID